MSIISNKNAVLMMQGEGVSRGIVMGRAIVMGAANLEVPHYLISADKVNSECERLNAALLQVHQELEEIKNNLPADAPKEIKPLITVQSLMVSDPTLAQEAHKLIQENAYNAEWALSTHGQVLANQFAVMQDEYFSERAADIRQVIVRTLNVLTGSETKPFNKVMNKELLQTSIVVAHDISPADMMNMRDTKFAGFVTDVGGLTSHTAIVARSMNVPAVVGLGNVRSLVRDQDFLIIDGESGTVIVNPSTAILKHYQNKENQYKEYQAYLYSKKDKPAISLDKKNIDVQGNIEFPEEVEEVIDQGGQGIGLFRTEFLYMGNRNQLPSEQEQYEAYSHVLQSMKDQPVTIRTLDIGADKALNDEATVAVNPALGLRAIRYCLAHPEIFRIQLRALLRASKHGHLKILLPMIAHLHELSSINIFIEGVKKELLMEGIEVNPSFEIGAMIETPAIAISIESFLKKLDFVSIGTNDLIQYTLAIDRVDNEVSHLYDPLHPAVLMLLEKTISAGKKLNKVVSVCGEMAGDPLYTRLLLALGLDTFSMNPSAIPEIKHIIRHTHIANEKKKVIHTLNTGEYIQLDATGMILSH